MSQSQDTQQSESCQVPPKPTSLAVEPGGIPDRLKRQAQWVCWTYVYNPKLDKWDKPPLNARTGAHASSTDPATWTDFDTALAAMRTRGWDGIGYVVTGNDMLTGIDVDDCRDVATGDLHPDAARLIQEFDSYAEITPSRTGIRIWIGGTLIGISHNHRTVWHDMTIELYSEARYFTVTGVEVTR